MLKNLHGSPEPPTPHADEQPSQPLAPEEQPEEAGSVGGTIRELLETVLFILLIFFIVRGLIQNFRIDGSSMEPNLHNDQYILVNKVVFFHFDTNAPLRLLPGYRSVLSNTMYPIRMPRRGDV